MARDKYCNKVLSRGETLEQNGTRQEVVPHFRPNYAISRLTEFSNLARSPSLDAVSISVS